MEEILSTLMSQITLEIIEDLSNLDINYAPTNRTLSSIVQSIQSIQSVPNNKVIKEHQWSSNFEWLDHKNPNV